MRIEVTAEDIAKGKRYDCLACPIALALRRATGLKRTSARTSLLYAMRDDGTTEEWPVPVIARRFMDDFDRGDHVEPFSFDIDLPSPPPISTGEAK